MHRALVIAIALVAAPSGWQPPEVYRITAYCPCAACCGEFSDGIFADGSPVDGQHHKAVAAPPEIPHGTHLWIEGVGPVTVRDRGGAIKGKRLDLFCRTHADALSWGVQHRKVWIWKEGE